jgi:hypothetical protein
VLDGQLLVLFAPGVAAVSGTVVGQDPFDADAVVGEERPGSGPERQRGGRGLVVEGLAVGQAGVGVDGGVDVAVAQVRPAVTDPWPVGVSVGSAVAFTPAAAQLAPAAAVGDIAELLDVDVDQLARAAHFIAPDRFAGDPVDVPEPVDPARDQHPVHRRGRPPDPGRDRNRTQPLLPPQVHDRADNRLRSPPR